MQADVGLNGQQSGNRNCPRFRPPLGRALRGVPDPLSLGRELHPNERSSQTESSIFGTPGTPGGQRKRGWGDLRSEIPSGSTPTSIHAYRELRARISLQNSYSAVRIRPPPPAKSLLFAGFQGLARNRGGSWGMSVMHRNALKCAEMRPQSDTVRYNLWGALC